MLRKSDYERIPSSIVLLVCWSCRSKMRVQALHLLCRLATSPFFHRYVGQGSPLSTTSIRLDPSMLLRDPLPSDDEYRIHWDLRLLLLMAFLVSWPEEDEKSVCESLFLPFLRKRVAPFLELHSNL